MDPEQELTEDQELHELAHASLLMELDPALAGSVHCPPQPQPG